MGLSVLSPDSGTTQDAFENKLCDCSGFADPPIPGLTFSAVRIWGCDPQTGQQKPMSGACDVLIGALGGGGEWSSAATVPCRAQANPSANNSSVIVQAEWLDESTFPPSAVLDPTTPAPILYKAKIVAACGGGA